MACPTYYSQQMLRAVSVGDAYHRPVKNSIEWRSYHPNRVLVITPLRRRCEDVVEQLQHMVVVANLLMAHRVAFIRFLRRYFLKHGVDQHVDTCVALYNVFELSQDRMQLLRVVFHALNDARQPSFVDAVVCRKPGAGPVNTVFVRNVLGVFLMRHNWTIR